MGLRVRARILSRKAEYTGCADGMDKQVKVLSIDSAATPPSVVIDIDGREHTTVATNLSLHPT